MAIWKAVITETTNLDPTGKQEAIFNIIDPDGKIVEIDKQVIFLRASGNPTTIEGNITQEATKFVAELIASANLKPGNEIAFEV